jgi:hypothetical protein
MNSTALVWPERTRRGRILDDPDRGQYHKHGFVMAASALPAAAGTPSATGTVTMHSSPPMGDSVQRESIVPKPATLSGCRDSGCVPPEAFPDTAEDISHRLISVSAPSVSGGHTVNKQPWQKRKQTKEDPHVMISLGWAYPQSRSMMGAMCAVMNAIDDDRRPET